MALHSEIGPDWNSSSFAQYLFCISSFMSICNPSFHASAPGSTEHTHEDLFLRHRQMGSSLESCSKLEERDCSFQERESFGSIGICFYFRATISQGTIRSSQIPHLDFNKGFRTCRQLVSLGENSDSGKHPISIRTRAYILDSSCDWSRGGPVSTLSSSCLWPSLADPSGYYS